MLRVLVLLLFVANLVFYAWTQDWLGDLIPQRLDAQRDPQRAQRQVHPEAMRLMGPASGASAAAVAAASAAEPAASPVEVEAASAASQAASLAVAAATTSPGTRECLEAGPFTAEEKQRAEAALRAILPAGAWQERDTLRAGLWMVYMGPYTSPDLQQAKERELREIGIVFAPVRTPGPYAGGLSLGRFEQRSNAEAKLASLVQQGVRTARIATVRAPQTLTSLRVPEADAAARTALTGLSGALSGKTFGACGAEAETL